jgi:hypothetical protein
MIKKALTCVFLAHAFMGLGQEEEIFHISGNYTVPQNTNRVFIEVVGAGGNGKSNGLSGGGGGGYSCGIYDVSPGEILTVTVGQNSGTRTSSVNSLLLATGGTDATFERSSDGYGIAGVGGKGSGGNISNRNGGNGGRGYWTYYGGGGGGAAGRNGNGNPGGSTSSYAQGSCPHNGGYPGISGGYPGGNGSKGAGYLNCQSESNSISPATAAESYGAGGGGGNGNGSPSTNGTNGWVRISTCLIDLGITQLGLTLHSNQQDATYQWVDENYNPIPNAVNRAFPVKQTGNYAVIVSNGSCADTSAFIHIAKADLIKDSQLYGSLIFEQDAIYTHQNTLALNPIIEVVGAGGNGGSNGLGGGGAGGYASGVYTLTENTDYTVTVGQNTATRTSSFSTLISATGGTNASFTSDDNGYKLGGSGGTGVNGNIANYQGGNGGKGFWTYYGGGGGGAAGRKGNGNDGGYPQPYTPSGCPDQGGTGGYSGGYPGGHGGKGAGYNDCTSRLENSNPAALAQKYGAGGGGGNGNGSLATLGADGVVIINFCNIDFEVTQTDNLLEIHAENGTFQWVKISEDSSITLLSGETGRTFTLPEVGVSYAVHISNGTCSGYSALFQREVISSLNHNQTNDRISFYPNPANDYITVEADKNDLEAIRILSLNGTELLSQTRNNLINVRTLPEGFYILQITTKTKTYNQQVHIR